MTLTHDSVFTCSSQKIMIKKGTAILCIKIETGFEIELCSGEESFYYLCQIEVLAFISGSYITCDLNVAVLYSFFKLL